MSIEWRKFTFGAVAGIELNPTGNIAAVNGEQRGPSRLSEF